MTQENQSWTAKTKMLAESLTKYFEVNGHSLICRNSLSGELILPFIQSAEITEDWTRAISSIISTPTGVARTKGRFDAWESGWSKCLDEALTNPKDFMSFVPHYIKNSGGQYLVNAQPSLFNENPEVAMAKATTQLIIDLAKVHGANTIMECGCGTGWRLALLRQHGFTGHLLGTDWTEASKHCVQLLNENFQTNLSFRHMDLTDAKPLLKDRNSMVLTYGALEQLNTEWASFWQMCENSKDKNIVFVHFEPIASMYELENPNERLMLALHKAKNYLEGYAEHLFKERDAGRIHLDEYRLPLGSRFLETANLLIWKFR